MLLMRFKNSEEHKRAMEHVAKQTFKDHVGRNRHKFANYSGGISFFETTIRYLGGLLSACGLSGDLVLGKGQRGNADEGRVMEYILGVEIGIRSVASLLYVPLWPIGSKEKWCDLDWPTTPSASEKRIQDTRRHFNTFIVHGLEFRSQSVEGAITNMQFLSGFPVRDLPYVSSMDLVCLYTSLIALGVEALGSELTQEQSDLHRWAAGRLKD
ncbi:uncharacterized protein EI90DRAFT_3201563 [Cantharellus anzutake]|uniref:uncharacterized protein n=1 Tax=Cantharellus anzutake TaxID=1750568 RepID=UPI001907371F|nr:uncharacterized protein EI90DRAFT_3201563 [Cantharellus anzutake]KAF8330920.1 hypothetical protein EI90DRAFT_3201563 [Cantharellus anzutake]